MAWKPSSRDKRRHLAGFTLVEMLVVIAISMLVLAALGTVVGEAVDAHRAGRERNELARSARFAMNHMVHAVTHSRRLLVPLVDSPKTGQNESLRDPGVLAVTLDPTMDRNADGILDADNDGDGLIDEDLPADVHDDGKPGIIGVDDNNDTLTDFSFGGTADDDESGLFTDEDKYDGSDDDNDHSFDEDPPADNNGDGKPGVAGIDDDGDGVVDEGLKEDDDEDGQIDEDWYDPVVFRLDNGQLIERMPVPWDANGDTTVSGTDYVESAIIENVTRFSVQRVEQQSDEALVVILILEVTADNGDLIALETHVRVGGSL